MMKVVVVGHGMVGSRFVDDLVRHAKYAAVDVAVTVLADEPYEPYNRLMLSEVIAGRADLASLSLPQAPAGVEVRQGVAALAIDRQRRIVTDAEQVEHEYDVLVFATGAEPRMPKIPGLAASGGRGVRAVRTLDDCRELLAACEPGRRMVVLGGGLLGVEIAAGLRHRGVDVILVHRAGHLMDRQLDEPSARMVAAALDDLGIDVRLESGVTRVLRERGVLCGLELPDGDVLPTDLLVVNTGVQPRVSLARAAGVPTDIGILVDERLRALDDESVAAVGDCAQTDAGCTGLIAPGWEQAGRLARDLVRGAGPSQETDGDGEAESAPETSVVKLKARGVEMVALGPRVPEPFEAHRRGVRVVSMHDVAERRSVTVAVRGERIVSAVIVGSPRLAADLTTAYERSSPLPLDPAHLLVKGAASPEALPEVSSPTTIPNSATVCRCNGVTKKQIIDAHTAGHREVADVALATRATTGCGGCTSSVCGILEWMDAATGAPAARESDAAQIAAGEGSQAQAVNAR